MSFIYWRGNLSQQIRECVDKNSLSVFRPMHNDQSAPDFIFSSLIIFIPELLFFFLHFFPFPIIWTKPFFLLVVHHLKNQWDCNWDCNTFSQWSHETKSGKRSFRRKPAHRRRSVPAISNNIHRFLCDSVFYVTPFSLFLTLHETSDFLFAETCVGDFSSAGAVVVSSPSFCEAEIWSNNKSRKKEEKGWMYVWNMTTISE